MASSTQNRCNLVIVVTLLAALQGCVGEIEGAGGDVRSGEGELVASLQLENGNRLEFYDFGDGVLVGESGDAYARPLFEYAGEGPEELTAIWTKFARGQAVPRDLIALQERLLRGAASVPMPGDSASGAATPAALPDDPGDHDWAPSEGASIDKSNCRNGCCNRDWLLSEFSLCHTEHRFADRQWFAFDQPSPQVSANDVFQFQGLVCAANSSATWDVTIGGRLRRFSIPQGHFQGFSWIAGVAADLSPWNEKNIQTIVRTVNGPNTIGTASYCGMMNIE
jgi:hypothetical protein